jgi:hypothetical protein
MWRIYSNLDPHGTGTYNDNNDNNDNNNNNNVYYANFGPTRGIQSVHIEKEA